MVTSFPDASKISSRFGQNLATPRTTGREPAGASHPHAPPPACRKWVQILRSQIPVQTFPAGLDTGSACTSSGHTHSANVCQGCLYLPSLQRQQQPTALGCICPGFAISLRVLFLPTWGCYKAQANTAPCKRPHSLICSWSGISSGSPQILFISYPGCSRSALE